jgi:hydroxymethylglutaryl-CoA lyase
VARVAEIDAAIGAWTRSARGRGAGALDAASVPAGRIYTVADIAADPHYRARGMLQPIRHVAGRTPINISLSTAFGCPMEGDVPQDTVLGYARRFAELGVRGLTICDTTGMAHPAQVSRMTEALVKEFGGLQLTMHFHNTRGMGLANVLAALQGGIVRFDGSLGGLGGCPYAPGASGNISSEDAIHMLAAMGATTRG